MPKHKRLALRTEAWGRVTMPIFVSRFSSGRVAGANLQQVRSNADQTTERSQNNTGRRETSSGQNQQAEDSRTEQRTTQLRETLPVASALADQLTGQLQTARQNQSAQTSLAPSIASRDNTRQTPVPGVGAVRTQEDDAVERPGRLTSSSNTALNQAISRFAHLREAVRGNGGQGVQNRDNANTSRNAGVAEVPRLNQGLDVRIRQGARAKETDRPTPEQISQANTTPEIRASLQSDSREVARGLTRDVAVQTRESTLRTAQSAAQSAQSQREDVQQTSQGEVRELQIEQRQLERELRQTEREIRQQRNQALRADNPVSQGTVSTAAAIGSNVNILAG